MSLNRKKFYDYIRANLFHSLTQSQVNGMETVLGEWERRGLADLRWLAYMFGTIYWETDKTMQPIEEYGKGHGRPYGQPDPITGKAYYGRGFVQLTWKGNYATMGRLLGVDLVYHPELALDPKIATQILFEGMTKGISGRGDFTGVSLETYFNSQKTDWYNARKIINGLDHSGAIGNFAKIFYNALI